jgi:hypothetical protein
MKSKSCSFDLAQIPQTNGLGLEITVPGETGFANSKGDFNKDGIDDIIFYSGLESNLNPEVVYVIYGSRSFNQSVIDLNNMNSQQGFGLVFDKSPQCQNPAFITKIDTGFDYNHDGIDDIYVSVICSGKYGYVIYGQSQPFPIQPIYFSDLPQSYYDVIGFNAITAGDLNGDGFGDLMVPGNSTAKKREGEVNYSTQISYILGKGQEVIFPFQTGCNIFDNWYEVPAARLGDVNGDGLADIAVSNPYNTNNFIHQSGSVYVIYGSKNPVSFTINNITPDQGYMINGFQIGQMCGQGLNYIGSINGNDINDISLSCGNGNMFVVYGQKGSSINSIDLSTINATTGLFANSSSFNSFYIVPFAGLDSFSGQNASSFMLNTMINAGAFLPTIFQGQSIYPFPFNYRSVDYVNITDSLNEYPYSSANQDIGDVNGDGIRDFGLSTVQEGAPQQTESIYILFGNESFFDCP